MLDKLRSFLEISTKDLNGVIWDCYAYQIVDAYRIRVEYNNKMIQFEITSQLLRNNDDFRIVLRQFNDCLQRLGYSRKKQVFKEEVDKILGE